MLCQDRQALTSASSMQRPSAVRSALHMRSPPEAPSSQTSDVSSRLAASTSAGHEAVANAHPACHPHALNAAVL